MVGSFQVCSFLCYSLHSTTCRSGSIIETWAAKRQTYNANQMNSFDNIQMPNKRFHRVSLMQSKRNRRELKRTILNWDRWIQLWFALFMYLARVPFNLLTRLHTAERSSFHCTSLARDDVVEQVFVAWLTELERLSTFQHDFYVHGFKSAFILDMGNENFLISSTFILCRISFFWSLYSNLQQLLMNFFWSRHIWINRHSIRHSIWTNQWKSKKLVFLDFAPDCMLHI